MYERLLSSLQFIHLFIFIFLAIFTYRYSKSTKLENSPSGSSSRKFTYIDLSQMLKYTLINIFKK